MQEQHIITFTVPSPTHLCGLCEKEMCGLCEKEMCVIFLTFAPQNNFQLVFSSQHIILRSYPTSTNRYLNSISSAALQVCQYILWFWMMVPSLPIR